jgi:hypothetical protein
MCNMSVNVSLQMPGWIIRHSLASCDLQQLVTFSMCPAVTSLAKMKHLVSMGVLAISSSATAPMLFHLAAALLRSPCTRVTQFAAALLLAPCRATFSSA